MKDRLLNILLATFVFLLLLNVFLPKPPQQQTSGDVSFAFSHATTVVPNYPVVTVKNPTANGVSFDTCKELTVFRDLKTVVLEGTSASQFCKTIEIAAGGSQTIDMAPLAPLFVQPGNIGLKLALQGKEITGNIMVEERSTFRTFLSALFYAPILNLFVGILSYLPNHSLGLAIIIITIIVRLILLVPQHQMLVSARKMQEIQPKIKALQEKYKSDQAKMGMELMELYKREKVNPLGSCLPLLIQTPILIVLYWVLTSIQNTSNTFYLYPMFQSFDMTRIEHVFYGMNLLAIGGVAAYILAVVVGLTQFAQIWLSQRRTTTMSAVSTPHDPNSLMPDPALMNKFMLWVLPLIVAISTIYFPLGVGMYWFIGTLFMLVQQAIANAVADSEKSAPEILVPQKKAR